MVDDDKEKLPCDEHAVVFRGPASYYTPAPLVHLARIPTIRADCDQSAPRNGRIIGSIASQKGETRAERSRFGNRSLPILWNQYEHIRLPIPPAALLF